MMKNENAKPIDPIQSAYLNMNTAIKEIQWAQTKWGGNWIDCALHLRMAREQLESAEAKIRNNVKGLE
jgi:hypothetical protein